jgi:hypothetical protein
MSSVQVTDEGTGKTTRRKVMACVGCGDTPFSPEQYTAQKKKGVVTATSLKTEALAIKTRLEGLHEKLVEGSTAREFTLRALCALGGAVSHIPDEK